LRQNPFEADGIEFTAENSGGAGGAVAERLAFTLKLEP
jgi:hypothetical protein